MSDLYPALASSAIPLQPALEFLGRAAAVVYGTVGRAEGHKIQRNAFYWCYNSKVDLINSPYIKVVLNSLYIKVSALGSALTTLCA